MNRVSKLEAVTGLIAIALVCAAAVWIVWIIYGGC